MQLSVVEQWSDVVRAVLAGAMAESGGGHRRVVAAVGAVSMVVSEAPAKSRGASSISLVEKQAGPIQGRAYADDSFNLPSARRRPVFPASLQSGRRLPERRFT